MRLQRPSDGNWGFEPRRNLHEALREGSCFSLQVKYLTFDDLLTILLAKAMDRESKSALEQISRVIQRIQCYSKFSQYLFCLGLGMG